LLFLLNSIQADVAGILIGYIWIGSSDIDGAANELMQKGVNYRNR